MLAAMPTDLLEEWRIFDELDPPLSDRMDWGLAHIVQVLVRNQRPLREFMLPFGDTPKDATVVQSLEYQEMLINAWCAVNNAIVEKKGGTK